jgi:alpha-1,3-rhamnosyl/mannosyltransferase
MYRGRQRHVLTVHDMSSFTMPEHHIPLRRSWPYRQAIVQSVLRADAVLAVSEATRQAIREIVPVRDPARIQVIPLGINEEFHLYPAEQVEAARSRHGWPSSYMLYVGTIEPRKNLRRLVDSYAELLSAGDTTDPLLLAGKLGWGYEGLLRRMQEPDVKGKVQVLGYVPQADLPLLYAGAKLFVYPSRLEGFGFPPLEAMACGVPTISSLSSSLAENLQGAAMLVHPDDGKALTLAMREALLKNQMCAKLKEAGLQRAARFRWESTAQQTLQCYERVARGAA